MRELPRARVTGSFDRLLDVDEDVHAFLREIRHELRTPLNGILGFTEVLLGELEGPLTSAQQEDLEVIRASGQQLMTLVDELIDTSAAFSGRLKLRRQEIDVGALLKEVARQLSGEKRDRPIEIRLDVPMELPVLPADPVRLRQVLWNLGSNALKFTAAGEIILRAEQRGDHMRIGVTDTGTGISEKELSTVFGEFVQGAEETSRRRGFGLGLAISKKLVELHNGRIEVQSTEGRGFSFVAILPFDADGTDTTADEMEGPRPALDSQELRRRSIRLVAWVGHDSRSPLNSIRGFVEILLREMDGPLNEKQKESLAMILESSNELLARISGMIDAARQET